MTTIVYCHKTKQIACDSQESAGSFIVDSSCLKWIERGGVMYFSSGCSSDANAFIDNMKHNAIVPDGVDCTSIYVKDNKAYIAASDGERYKIDEMLSNEGIGTGGRYAAIALDFNLSAKEAVEYAIKKDVYTGGKVHVYDIEKGEFLS